MTLMDSWLQILLTAILAVAGSSGFWAYMQRRDSKRTQTDCLLQGLAYDRIIAMGMGYVTRGFITNDEYDDFRRYLYDPYKALGGNGVTERIMAAVTDLPLRPREAYSQVITAAKERGQDARDTATEYGAAA